MKKMSIRNLRQIYVDEAFRGADVQNPVVTVHACDELMAGRNEDFSAVVVHHHDGVVADFQKLAALADVTFCGIRDGEADDFVEIESVVGQLGEVAEGQEELHTDQIAGLVDVHPLELEDELVIAAASDTFDGEGDFLAVQVKENGGEVVVVFGMVGIKKGTQTTLQSERFGQCA